MVSGGGENQAEAARNMKEKEEGRGKRNGEMPTEQERTPRGRME